MEGGWKKVRWARETRVGKCRRLSGREVEGKEQAKGEKRGREGRMRNLSGCNTRVESLAIRLEF